MKKALSPAIIIGALVCVLGIAGFFLHRAYVGPRAYHGRLKLPDKPLKLVQTPTGYMTEEQAAKLGVSGAVSNTPASGNR